VQATSDGRNTRFRAGVLSEDGGRRVFVIDAPAALTAALSAFDRISPSPPAVIDVSPVRAVGRTRVTTEAGSGRRYRLSIKVVEICVIGSAGRLAAVDDQRLPGDEV
jgi:hypothetical protein